MNTAIITAVTTTPTQEGEVQSETELKVPATEKEKEVQSETELKVMSSPSSSAFAEATDPPTMASSTKPIEDYPENKEAKEKEQMQNITANRVLDEAKDKLRRCIDEARKEVPHTTWVYRGTSFLASSIHLLRLSFASSNTLLAVIFCICSFSFSSLFSG